MSRIGNRLLQIPNGVEVKIAENNLVTITGSKGTLSKQFSPLIKIEVEENKLITKRLNEQKHTKQLHGTTNSLLQGMLTGVSEGFKKELQITGVGYKAAVNGSKLNLSLGYSHSVEFEIPDGVVIQAVKPTELAITGIDKQLVGQVAANIRAYRKPEPYKGKGIKYKNETIIRKEGKAAGK
ncbi:50S ribosomal protein L6 [Mycoplasma capricolum subsp. capripneumoniae]|uniref:Large ribosomal subunit protein uL6 n=1 Tax=Mycoplasma capricolum subsp. capripneumoniae 87001 TaxID=1124992 RepID=A0A9N7ATB4_MYCCC|nr:50S ribosomal protein L6 [Mycoplasma capricolum]AJK51721.1 50S ribosomal protein L6 [Mycoplasma capricolum subsp. capripneumoniae 87001]AOQ22343.1 50S ribosomal protein L6 [Mycoplasma capricolum subsp. capripneumoniae M1601]AQU77672.1 50S ribosomal protein L6 [Mycoplasma capricolum subsp. capripneumoniae]KEY84689.1 50S ribosomal protein L6 [Mycoplasma capricolum subsp. capripneumoniae 99108]QDL19804.1 50S ribosomal protein L6 [Mycoplasma capricolum subsp. capripneumoniae]